ncbi:MAG: hypothetical protein DRN30_00300 [Thermoplasmata archaeon]|nr:MAG: hypothetical protein DRN30_00300 [Thermoplasmata archaeon]
MNTVVSISVSAVLAVIVLSIVCRVFIRKTLDYIKGSSRKYMEEEDFMRVSEVKYKHMYDIVIYRVLSTITFTALLSQLLILSSPLDVWKLFVLGIIMFALSFIIDALLQSITFRRVVQGVYRGVEVLRVGITAIAVYTFLSFAVMVTLVVIWLGSMLSIFGEHAPDVVILLMISAVTIFVISSLTVSGYSRGLLYIIAVIVTLALQKSVGELGIIEAVNTPPESFTVSLALVFSLFLMSLLCINTKKSRVQELRSYFYEVFLVMFLASLIMGLIALRGLLHYNLHLWISSESFRLSLIPTLFYAFYPFTRMYSTIQKSIEDLQRIMDYKTYYAFTFIPSLAAYVMFNVFLILTKIYGAHLKTIFAMMLIPFSIAFLFEYLIVFEALDSSITIMFKKAKKSAQGYTLGFLALIIVVVSFLFTKWKLKFERMMYSFIYLIVILSTIYLVIFLIFAVLSIKTEIKEA